MTPVGPAAKSLPPLLLYSRAGCCLCEGLQERLEALIPPPLLTVVDVDSDPALQARFGLEVPLLASADGRLLPRVPPRLQQDRLAEWLRRQLSGANSV